MFGPELISPLTALVSVVLIDIVLAGDNAVVVGTAAAGLPPDQQRRVIFFGAVLALVARVIFALVATQLLAIIGLLLAGGILLLWVAWKIWRELHTGGHAESDALGRRGRAQDHALGDHAGSRRRHLDVPGQRPGGGRGGARAPLHHDFRAGAVDRADGGRSPATSPG